MGGKVDGLSFACHSVRGRSLVATARLRRSISQRRQAAMAKILPGTPISDARGKVGTIVYTNNGHGLCSRAHVIPANPNTTAQQAARLALRTQMLAWQTSLTDAQRLAWQTYARTNPTTNAFGQNAHPTGLMLYLKATMMASRLGETPATDPPRGQQIQALDGITVTTSVSGTNLTITWTAQATPATNHALIFIGPIQTAGTSAPKGTWAMLATTATSSGTTGNIWTQFVTRFGLPAAGNKSFIKAHPYDSAPGVTGPEKRLGFQWAA